MPGPNKTLYLAFDNRTNGLISGDGLFKKLENKQRKQSGNKSASAM